MTQRQITLVNNSTTPTALALLQGGGVVWLSKYAYPGTQVRFTWDDNDYCFVWAGAAKVSPGVILDVSQVVPTALNQGNLIGISYDAANRTFFFNHQQDGPQQGMLYVRADQTLPVSAVAVGIGMAGKPTAVVPAQPNMNYSFQPRPDYRLAFGALTQSEVVDPETLPTHPISFPPNVYALTATLNADNTWTVESDILSKIDTDE
jgi:rhizosphere induced protein